MVLLVVFYIASIIAANLIIMYFGANAIPYVSFILIGFDFVIRDKLHDKINKLQMFLLIVVSGLITYIINVDTKIIAIASSISFTLASFGDWFVFHKASGSWENRSNKSNIVAAIIDSIIFPTIVFGGLNICITIMQIITKTFGGFCWVQILKRNNKV